MQVDKPRLAQRLLDDNVRFALVLYIFKVQGGEWKRLDFEAAAKELKIHRSTVSACIKELSDDNHRILQIRGKDREAELKISDEFLRDKPA